MKINEYDDKSVSLPREDAPDDRLPENKHPHPLRSFIRRRAAEGDKRLKLDPIRVLDGHNDSSPFHTGGVFPLGTVTFQCN